MSEIKKEDIPESLQQQILDFTGTKERGNAGFLMFYVNKSGDIEVVEKFEYAYMRSVFRDAIEQYMVAIGLEKQ